MPAMTAARAFNLAFALPVGALLAALLVATLNLNLQPLEGDLTRMGGYSTNDFGRPAGQESFGQVLTTIGRAYTPCDILVVGDSFSVAPSADPKGDPERPYWQNYLHQATGMRIHTLSAYHYRPERLLDDPTFRAHPPKVVLFELAEFQAHTLSAGAPRGAVPAGSTPRLAYPTASIPVRPAPRPRPTDDFHVDFSLTQNYLRKNLSRDWLGQNPTPVMALPMTRDDLFTSRVRNRLLVLKEHSNKQHWTAERLEKMRQRLLSLQARLQANGKTYFAFMVAPDRLTAYADYLADPAWRKVSRLEAFHRMPGLQIVRSDRALFAAIRRGTPDVYRPDDIHWSSTGHRIAAEAVREHLVAERVFAR